MRSYPFPSHPHLSSLFDFPPEMMLASTTLRAASVEAARIDKYKHLFGFVNYFSMSVREEFRSFSNHVFKRMVGRERRVLFC